MCYMWGENYKSSITAFLFFMHNVFSFVNEMLIPDMAMVAYVGKQLLGGLHFLQICNGYEYCCFCFLVLF